MVSEIPSRQTRIASRLVWAGMVIFVLVMFPASRSFNAVYAGHAQDTGNMWQTAWNLAHGHGFEFTMTSTGEQLSRLAIHSDYFLLLLAPLTRLWPNPDSFYFIQALVVAGGAWFVWSIAQHLFRSPWLSALFSLAYLVYGPLHFALLWQFHPYTLSITFILAAAEAVIKRRRTATIWTWMVLATLTKENVGAILGLFLFFLLWVQGRRRMAVAVVGVGVLWSALHFIWIIPAARPDSSSHFVWSFYYEALGSNDQERLLHLLDPSVLWGRFWTNLHLVTSLQLLLPFAWLPLLHPVTAVALIGLLPHWLSDNYYPSTIYHIAHVIAIPILVVAAMLGLGRLMRHGHQRFRTTTVGLFVLFWVLLGTYLSSPLPWSTVYQPSFFSRDPGLERFIWQARLIPPEATVMYSRETGPYFRSHPRTLMAPLRIEEADYIVLFEGLHYNSDPNPNFDRYLELRQWLIQTGAYKVVTADRRGIILQRNRQAHLGPIPIQFRLTELSL